MFDGQHQTGPVAYNLIVHTWHMNQTKCAEHKATPRSGVVGKLAGQRQGKGPVASRVAFSQAHTMGLGRWNSAPQEQGGLWGLFHFTQRYYLFAKLSTHGAVSAQRRDLV